MFYLVKLKSVLDAPLTFLTLCKLEDLKLLINNLDRKNYSIEKIKHLNMFNENFKDFVIKGSENLETGRKEGKKWLQWSLG